MRLVLGILAVIAVGVGISKHLVREQPAASVPPAAIVNAQPTAAATPARQPHWPKSALDRAAEVKQQVAQQRKENERK